jgi:hypothetical protein
MFMTWRRHGRRSAVVMPEFFSNAMDVAKMMQPYLQKEITEIGAFRKDIQ